MMDMFRDYLERSSVHGFSYISTEKSWIVKLLWSVVVICGFCLAGTMIGQSYVDWNKSPISSTLTTHPISELQLPTITVCPPEGSNTALNVDLMRVNESFTVRQKEQLQNEIVYTFITKSHMAYQHKLLALTDEESQKRVYDGFQSIPKYSDLSSINIRICALQGNISTPDISDTIIHYEIKCPDNLTTVVDLSLPPDMSGQVSYRAGPQYQYHPVALNWEDAEALCVTKGGHLASIHSRGEQEEVMAVVPEYVIGVWLGGKDKGGKEFSWSDSSAWDHTNWAPGEPSGNKQCVWMDTHNPTHVWADAPCTETLLPPVCAVQKVKIKESTTVFMNLTNALHVWVSQNISGFSFSWDTEDKDKIEALYQDEKEARWFSVVVNMVYQARQRKISNTYMLQVVNVYKHAYIESQIMTTQTCKTENMRWTYFAKVMEYMGLNSTVAQFASHGDDISMYKHNVTTDDLSISFYLFTFMIYCPPDNALELYAFFHHLVEAENPRTVIQATVSSLQSNFVTVSEEHRNNVKTLYQELDMMFRFRSDEALVGLSTDADLTFMMDRNLTALLKSKNNITKCLDTSHCDVSGIYVY